MHKSGGGEGSLRWGRQLLQVILAPSLRLHMRGTSFFTHERHETWPSVHCLRTMHPVGNARLLRCSPMTWRMDIPQLIWRACDLVPSIWLHNRTGQTQRLSLAPQAHVGHLRKSLSYLCELDHTRRLQLFIPFECV